MNRNARRVYMQKARRVILLLGVFFVFFLIIKVFALSNRFMEQTGLKPATLFRLVFDNGADLNPIDGRINVLLLGIPGGNHEGTDLTDTILVLSFHEKNKTLQMISVPRDIWSDTLKDKVNSAYHYGEVKKDGGGLILAKAIISDVVGLPIQYALVLDFSGFKNVIDVVGGVTVDVTKGFTDTEFPIPGKENDVCDGDPLYRCRYEALTFRSGAQVMDGEKALQYVRSRHAEGDEGSDFARGRRQQEVILALKEKLFTKEIFLDFGKVEQLYSAFDEATDTDMNIGELLTIGKFFFKTPKENTGRISLEEHLYTPPSSWYGRYVLLPREDFEEIHQFITTSLNDLK